VASLLRIGGRSRADAALVALALLVGCSFDPAYKSNVTRCSADPDRPCPEGFACVAGFCCRPGECAGGPADAAGERGTTAEDAPIGAGDRPGIDSSSEARSEAPAGSIDAAADVAAVVDRPADTASSLSDAPIDPSGPADAPMVADRPAAPPDTMIDAVGGRPTGAACASGDQCASGSCAGLPGRCCIDQCAGPCWQCPTGYCELVPDGKACGPASCEAKPTMPPQSSCLARNQVCRGGTCTAEVEDCCPQPVPYCLDQKTSVKQQGCVGSSAGVSCQNIVDKCGEGDPYPTLWACRNNVCTRL
jgi:hypothetical protein